MVDDFRAPRDIPITEEEAKRLAAPPPPVEDVPITELEANLLALKSIVDAPRTKEERIGSMEPLGGLARPRASQRRLDAVRRYKDLQVNNVITKLEGNPLYDPSESFVDSLDKIGLSFDLQRSNLFSEEYAKFKKQFPRGGIAPIQTDYGTVYVARTSPSEPYRRIDGWGDNTGRFASSFLNEDVAAGIAMGIATRKLPVIVAAPLTGLATGAANYVKNKIEEARGYQYSPEADLLGEAAGSAVLGTGAEVLGRSLTGAKSAYGELKAKIRLDVADIANRTGATILRGQGGNPLIRAMYRVTSPLSERAKIAESQQKQEWKRILEPLADIDPYLPRFSDDELANTLELSRARVSEAMQSSISGGPNALATGTELRSAATQMSKILKETTARLYGEANKNAADDLITFNLNRPVTVGGETYSGLKDMIKALRKPKVGPGTAPDGTPIDVPLNSPLSNPELKRIAARIEQLDDIVTLHQQPSADPLSSAQIVQELRNEVGNILSKEGIDSQTRSEASKIWSSLTAILDNPMGGSGAFQNSWKLANAAYVEGQKFLEIPAMVSALKDGVPAEEVALRVFKPNQYGRTKQIFDMLGNNPQLAPVVDTLRKGFLHSLVGNKEALLSAPGILEKYGKEELNLLLPGNLKRDVLKLSRQMNQFENGPVAAVLKRQRTDTEKLLTLANDPNVTEAELDEFIRNLGGRDSEAAAGLRAGVFNKLLNDSLVVDEVYPSQKVVDPKLLNSKLNGLFKSNRLNALFNAAETQRFKDWESVTKVISENMDLGAQMSTSEKAGIVAGIVQNVRRGTSQLLSLATQDMLGGWLSQPLAYERIKSLATTQDVRRVLTRVFSANASLLNDYSKQARKEKFAQGEPFPGRLSPEDQKAVLERIIQQGGSRSMGQDVLQYLQELYNFGGAPEPKTDPAAPTPAPGPASTGVPTLPATPAPAPQAAPSGQQGSLVAPQQYGTLFPNDTLGQAIAQRGIMSLQG